MSQGASATVGLTKIYYSGSDSQFNQTRFEAFYGKGSTVSAGYGAEGFSASLEFSWAGSSLQNFTISIGGSFGFGTTGWGLGRIETGTEKW